MNKERIYILVSIFLEGILPHSSQIVVLTVRIALWLYQVIMVNQVYLLYLKELTDFILLLIGVEWQ